MADNQSTICKAVLLCMLVCVCLGVSMNAVAEESAWANFVPPPDNEFDWIQLKSGEWLKGELKVLYEYQLEFDSDELELLTFDMEDIKQIRTSKPQSIRIEDTELSDRPFIVEGILTVIDNKVIVTVGDESREFMRHQVVSIAQGKKKELDFWSASITLGATVRGGNTDTVDSNLRINVKRRSAYSRLELEYVGNFSRTEDIETTNNHRLNGLRDSFISKKYFWRQLVAEYYRDPFKNIDDQLSLATLLGYHIIRTPKTEWYISVGVGGRYTEFVSVEPGQSIDNTSPALGAGTKVDTELTNWMDFLVDYSFELVDKESGSYTHHFITTLSTDFAGDIDLDISFVWDRIQDPQPDSDGVVPDQDDYQLVIGFSFDI
jgi:hypothetical protein